MKNFSVVYRNPGHWDIYIKKERICRIRGETGEHYVISDNFRIKEPTLDFKTVQACMSYICDKLMYENPSKGEII